MSKQEENIQSKNAELAKDLAKITNELQRKNRELEIEVSLEKVRARTMAMRHSDELAETAYILFQQFRELGENPDQATIGIINEAGGVIEYWVTIHGNQTDRVYKFPVDEPNVTQKIYKAWEAHHKSLVIDLSGKALHDFSKFRESMGGAAYNPGEKRRIINVAFFSRGLINVQSTTERSAESRHLLERFASVFEGTYTRFLDLKNAEAQAREAQTELTLERVRARTMAMQKSSELAGTVSVLFKQLLSLGIRTEQIRTCGIVTFDDKKPIGEQWITETNGEIIPQSFTVRYDEAPAYKAIYKAWKQRRQFVVIHLEGKKLKEHLGYLAKGTNVPTRDVVLPQQAKKIFNHVMFFSRGCLFVITKEALPEYHEIFKRFGAVFQQSYTRFLDLQKAEGQAREAQIEAALERVRSSTMAMQKSKDLAHAVAIIFEELDKLNLSTLRCGIGILDKEKCSANVWTTTKSDGENVVHVSGDEPMNVHPLLQGAFDAWVKQDEDWAYVLQGADLNNFYIALTGTNFKLPDSQSILTDVADYKQYYYVATFQSGNLYAFRETGFTLEAKTIIKRFAGVFDFTYKRFNDLKVAEAHSIRAEQDLLKLHAEKKRAEQALTDLKAAQTQLIQSEKMASLGELTAGIAHEIQNPLNFVNNFSEVNREMIDELEEELRAGNIEEALAIAADIKLNEQKINHHGKRADGIVKGMLQHSRTNSGKKEDTDINALADEYLRLSYHGLRAKDKSFNADMVTRFEPKLPKISVIQQDIGRVMLNLFNNAFYAVNQKTKTADENYKPTVEVNTAISAKKLVITVRDNGNGIPDAIKDKIMQPFFTTKPTGEGTGLGLSLSYDIVVKGHGGNIDINTKEGEFTEFIIALPLT